jgi:predicted Zn-dependent protease with MMP-like domain
MIEVAPDRFEELVARALDGLPADLAARMRNVAVTVEHGKARPGFWGSMRGFR